MSFAERRYQRLDESRIPTAGERRHRGTSNLPILVGHRRRQRSQPFDRIHGRQTLDSAHPGAGAGVAQLDRELVLQLETFGDVLNRDRKPDPLTVSCQRRHGDALLHPIETSGGTGGGCGDEVLVESGREHRRCAGDKGAPDDGEQAA